MDDPGHENETDPVVVDCPICMSGAMQAVSRGAHITICMCLICGTSISVPDEAWKRRPERG